MISAASDGPEAVPPKLLTVPKYGPAASRSRSRLARGTMGC